MSNMAGAADVSVVIATRERPEFLRRCLVAVFSQDAEVPVEAIVVFDRSEPDNSLLSEFAGERLILLTNQRSPGLAGARNTGMLASQATWVAYCDDDDAWLSDKLSRQLSLGETNPDCNFIVGGLIIDNGTSEIERRHSSAVLHHSDFLRSRVAEAHPSTFLLRRSPFLQEVGLMDEGLAMATDHDLLLRYSAKKDVLAVTDPVVRISMHAISYFTSNWDNRLAEMPQMLARHPDLATDPEGMARFRSRRAFALAASGQRMEAMKESAAALRLNWKEVRAFLAIAVSLSLVHPDTLARLASRRGRGI